MIRLRGNYITESQTGFTVDEIDINVAEYLTSINPSHRTSFKNTGREQETVHIHLHNKTFESCYRIDIPSLMHLTDGSPYSQINMVSV